MVRLWLVPGGLFEGFVRVRFGFCFASALIVQLFFRGGGLLWGGGCDLGTVVAKPNGTRTDCEQILF